MRFFALALGVGVGAVILGVLPDAGVVSAGSKASDRGAEIFATHGCAHCHGDKGVGGGRGPDLQLVRKRLSGTAIAQQIHDGGKGMPSYADQLNDVEVDDLVAFLKAKRPFVVVPKPAEETPKPPANKPDPG